MPTQKEPKPPFPPQNQDRPGLDSEMDPKPRHEAPNYRAAGKLKDRAALITGGDSGIGASVAVLFAREGADVAIVYLPEEQSDAEHVRKHVEKERRKALLIPGDVRDSGFCEQAVEKTINEFGKLDILVNNAAYMHRRESIDDVTDEELDKTFRTNIYGYFYMARAALKHMKEGSVIINTGSVAGMEGPGSLLDYAATKGAIHAFTKSLAQSLIERKIRVNCVAPGPIWTPLNASARSREDMATYGADGVPMGRPGQPEELSPAYVFFASEADSSYISGEVLSVYGGKTQAG
ncbi:MAG TPA: SDR family oxidoreductase [Isosphaeraceae bacterium]|nr:SDR family oxidoreductase [Isosphaeraceae bacterium]